MAASGIKKQVDYEAIAKKGDAIYEKIKHRYEPKDNDRMLAIEVESGDIFLADDTAQATAMAKKKHPEKIIYLIRIGFQTAEAVHEANKINLHPHINL